MKLYQWILAGTLFLTSCSGFLDREPNDALSPGTFFKTEEDAMLALTGCYNRWWDSSDVLEWDSTSDNSYSFHIRRGYQVIGNGTMTPTNPGAALYSYTTIDRCNVLLENLDRIPFKSESVREQIRAEARFLRAWRYFVMTVNYGGVPLFVNSVDVIEDARKPRESFENLCSFIETELEAITKDGILPKKTNDGRISQGAALALQMRYWLYREKYADALASARRITKLGYKLFADGYENIFTLENENNDEIILSCQAMQNDYKVDIQYLLPNSNGGWSAHVPTQSLVDAYEMKSGLTIEEAQSTGEYDPVHPFRNRDPRLKATVLYPGQDWRVKGKTIIFDPLDPKSNDYPTKANNATKTAYNFKKYLAPTDQFPDIRNTGIDVIVFRYAEVLLTIAEAKIELGEIDEEMYSSIDQVRQRAGMPAVDRAKYADRESLRELIRRERRVEFAFEGMRRYDIIRWGIANEVMNGKVWGCAKGKVIHDATLPEEDRVELTPDDHFFVEDRVFDPAKNIYLPIPQSEIDQNPALTSDPY